MYQAFVKQVSRIFPVIRRTLAEQMMMLPVTSMMIITLREFIRLRPAMVAMFQLASLRKMNLTMIAL